MSCDYKNDFNTYIEHVNNTKIYIIGVRKFLAISYDTTLHTLELIKVDEMIE